MTWRAIYARPYGLEFSPKMLAWEPGPRPQVDGVWAPWWYKTTHESTGFGPLQLKPVAPMPENIRELVEEARPFYYFLRRHALKPEKHGGGGSGGGCEGGGDGGGGGGGSDGGGGGVGWVANSRHELAVRGGSSGGGGSGGQPPLPPGRPPPLPSAPLPVDQPLSNDSAGKRHTAPPLPPGPPPGAASEGGSSDGGLGKRRRVDGGAGAGPSVLTEQRGGSAEAAAAEAKKGGTHAYTADPRNADVLIGIRDGVRDSFELVWRPEAKVSVFDSGFMLGDGVWEGIRLHRGVLIFIDQHIRRLYQVETG